MTQQNTLELPIRNRVAAGRMLARLLTAYQQRPEVIVLGLPRGGVPVAYEVASALLVRLDLMLVRKLGVPGYEELAMGAIAEGGVRVLSPAILHQQRIDEVALAAVTERQSKELQRRERAYRGDRAVPQLRNQQVILVDDGLATGATMQAAVQAVQRQNPQRIIVAVPVAAADSLEVLHTQVDEIICPHVTNELISIGRWYLDFTQVSDDEVLALLTQAWQRENRTA
jgi:putative phosphoribosyl transferase